MTLLYTIWGCPHELSWSYFALISPCVHSILSYDHSVVLLKMSVHPSLHTTLLGPVTNAIALLGLYSHACLPYCLTIAILRSSCRVTALVGSSDLCHPRRPFCICHCSCGLLVSCVGICYRHRHADNRGSSLYLGTIARRPFSCVFFQRRTAMFNFATHDTSMVVRPAFRIEPNW